MMTWQTTQVVNHMRGFRTVACIARAKPEKMSASQKMRRIVRARSVNLGPCYQVLVDIVEQGGINSEAPDDDDDDDVVVHTCGDQ